MIDDDKASSLRIIFSNLFYFPISSITVIIINLQPKNTLIQALLVKYHLLTSVLHAAKIDFTITITIT